MRKVVPVSLILTIAVSLCLFADVVNACTTFCLRAGGEVLIAWNYDYDFGDALVFVNKRGVSKKSLADAPQVAKWTAAYGSVTFNQYGRENPTGGMNERGLVVEELWLDNTEYSKDDSVPALGVQEWIQYELDTAATVDEAIEHARAVRIADDVTVHYFVSDPTGATAAIEYLRGILVIHTRKTLPVPVLTNDAYEASIAFANNTPISRATTDGSLHRFARAAQRVKAFEAAPLAGESAITYALDTLSNVRARGWSSSTGRTQWTIVYDLKRRKIHFRTLCSPQLKTIDATRFESSCSTPVTFVDIDTPGSGDITERFAAYTRSANRDLIERSFNATEFLKDTPPRIRNLVAAYPERFPCTTR